MRPESISDVEWEHPGELAPHIVPNLAAYPTKNVIVVIQAIEGGQLPVVEITANYEVVKSSYRTFEAYLRCHFSRVPVRFVEKEASNADQRPVPERF